MNGVTGVEYDGATNNCDSGLTLAMGDVNGDGLSDLVIGPPGNCGIEIVFGNKCGEGYSACTSPVSLTTAFLNGTNGAIYRLSAPSAFTSFLTVGDANGDGLSDILVGSGDQTVNSNANAGEAYLIFCRKSWLAGHGRANAECRLPQRYQRGVFPTNNYFRILFWIRWSRRAQLSAMLMVMVSGIFSWAQQQEMALPRAMLSFIWAAKPGGRPHRLASTGCSSPGRQTACATAGPR